MDINGTATTLTVAERTRRGGLVENLRDLSASSDQRSLVLLVIEDYSTQFDYVDNTQIFCKKHYPP